MKSPITFKDWLSIVGVLFVVGVGFILLKQIPFIENFLDGIRGFFEIQGEYIH